MYDTDVLERINVEQIVTATDRLLFGNVRKRRPTARPSTDLTVAIDRSGFAGLRSNAKRCGGAIVRRNDDRTVHVRGNATTSRLALFGAAAAAIAWLTVAVVCLLA